VSSQASAVAFLFLLVTVPLHAQVTVQTYRVAFTDDAAKLLVQEYIKGLGEGIMIANLEAEEKKVSLFCPPQNLALRGDNYVDITDREIKELEAKKYPAAQLDKLLLSVTLMKGLEETFPCPDASKK